MNDRDHLIWIHARLVRVYRENPHVDFMHRLRAVILGTPPNRTSPNVPNALELVDLETRRLDGEGMSTEKNCAHASGHSKASTRPTPARPTSRRRLC